MALTTDREAGNEPRQSAARLSSEIKRRRELAGLSQPQLASLIGYTRQYVSHAERNKNLPSAELIHALETALNAGGELFKLWREAKADQVSRRDPGDGGEGFQDLVAEPVDSVASGRARYLLTPPGRYFAGTSTPVVVAPAVLDDGRVITTSLGALREESLGTPRRSMLLASIKTPDGNQYYGLDRRRARARLTAANPGSPLLFPPAYLLDDFTLAIMWAVTNLDDALLDDDVYLADATARLNSLEGQARSAVGRDSAADLSPVSTMWLGSDVCARHILHHASRLAGPPRFWAREQRGEEACTWLLFTHKYNYLLATADMDTDAEPVRAFCIPQDAVAASGRRERILLLLTAALIESMGIRIAICVEPEYTATPGFVLDRGRRAIVATWVNTDQIWHVDITDRKPVLTEFSDTVGWASTHSIIRMATPPQRLCALADYLSLDWTWLVERARDIANYGGGGLVPPRSRLLSLAGLERACRFLADVGRASQ
ncbi:helix-turn-helix transcriptional regulator [Nocardia cyriacigeorgica]|uniref:Helix-turn-helix transcriptional regulator n=1 Tax=Nocardia cyriacigeorgica TaxID=135487 RepID=A0A5R8PGQ9_9NOCA|nr:helix-turn-helix transcriptional regulator [Nocardia cyriacigeorgica]